MLLQLPVYRCDISGAFWIQLEEYNILKKSKKKKKNSLRVLMHSVDDSEDRCLSTEVIHPGVTLSPLPKVESFQRTGKHATQLQM